MKITEHHSASIDRLLPVQDLLDMASFERRVAGRVEEYLTSEGMIVLSLRQLMDLFLPFSHPAPVERCHTPPILRQRQFGRYLYSICARHPLDRRPGGRIRDVMEFTIALLPLHKIRTDDVRDQSAPG